MNITKEILLGLGANEVNTLKYLAPFNTSLASYKIDNPLRIAHFLSQCFHESGNLVYSEEIASGAAYEGRKDLGNTVPGDGTRFKGRGLIQVTGRNNYAAYGKYSGKNSVGNPALLKTPELAVDSACWFFAVFKKDIKGNTLSMMADADDFLRITYFVNGGFNGIKDRFNKLRIAYKSLGVDNVDTRIANIGTRISNILKIAPADRTAMQKALMKEIPNTAALQKFLS